MGCCKIRSGMPSVAAQAVNLTLSLANVLAHAIKHGVIGAKVPVIQKRLDICLSCRHLVQIRCNVCGCYVDKKAALAAEKCPIGKW